MMRLNNNRKTRLSAPGRPAVLEAKTRKSAWLVGLALLASQPVLAQDDWGDDWGEPEVKPSPWTVTGFLEAGGGWFTHDNIVDSGASLGELSGRLEADYQHDKFTLTAKGEVRYDKVLSELQWDTRALYLSFSPLDNLDVKFGRQVLTWGTGDYLFLNDLFAKDWQSFFSGRDDEYLKAPSDSLRLTWYVDKITFDLAWTPKFTSDNYLTGERFSFYSPMAGGQVAPAEQFKTNSQDDDQWSLRIATSRNGVEYALYGYHGYWTTPQGMTSTGMGWFPRLDSWGASVRRSLGPGLFNAEYAYYDSKDDSEGSNPLVANGQHRLLFGYEQEVVKNLTASVQYYLERTTDFNALRAANPMQAEQMAENRQLLTLRLTYRAMQQKLVLSLFSFYSPSDDDHYLRPSVSYRQDDHWSYSAGGNLFGGDHNYSFFGQHEDNSNLWARVRYQF